MTDKRLTVRWPYLLLWVLQILDIVSTALVLDSGKGFESNPMMAGWLTANFAGFAVGLTIKCFAVWTLYASRHRHVMVFNTALLLAGVYLLIVAGNLNIFYF